MVEVTIKPGRYVVAVSGGVDSVVLLDVLAALAKRKTDIQLVVAHFDHGIREDSSQDKELVEQLALQYGLSFTSEEGRLGQAASEALAREKRYDFLHRVKQDSGASAIITAHHQDDAFETAILNLLRGTGRLGLSSLRSSPDIIRPLLGVRKADLSAYAQAKQLMWREDSTNSDDKYARNYVRLSITPRFSSSDWLQFQTLLERAKELNDTIDELLGATVQQYTRNTGLDRRWFMSLPHVVAKEVLIAWLRTAGVQLQDRQRVEQLVVLAKTLAHGKLVDVDAGFQLRITARNLALIPRER
jgi:tRNA(Ile)-lysidine synthase